MYILSELQKEDAEREAQQQKIDDLERLKQEQIERIEAEVRHTTPTHNLVHVLINNATDLKSSEKNSIRIVLVQTKHFSIQKCQVVSGKVNRIVIRLILLYRVTLYWTCPLL